MNINYKYKFLNDNTSPKCIIVFFIKLSFVTVKVDKIGVLSNRLKKL